MSNDDSFRRARVSFAESTRYHEGSGKKNLWLPSAKLNDPDKPFRRTQSEEALVPERGIGTHPPRGVYKAYRSYTKHLIDATGTPSTDANRVVVFERARKAAVDMEMLHSHQQGRMTLENYAQWVASFPPLCDVRHPLQSREYTEDVAMHAARAIHSARLMCAD